MKMPMILACTVLSTSLLAAEEPAARTWKSSAEVGFVSTSGNTETETLNAKGKVSTDHNRWRHKLEATALNASDRDGTTAEKYTLNGQSDYKLQDPAFLFVTISYEKDRFGGYDYQVTESVGYGRRVIDQSTLSLDLEIGPGARQSKLDSGQSQNEGLVRGAAKLNWALSESGDFAQNLIIEAGEDTTITKSETSLSSQVNGNLSMKLTLTIKNTSDVPPGIDKTDSETGVTLVYAF